MIIFFFAHVLEEGNPKRTSFLKKMRAPRDGDPPDGWERPGARSRKVGSLKKKWHQLLSTVSLSYACFLFFFLGTTMERGNEHKVGLLRTMHFLKEEQE